LLQKAQEAVETLSIEDRKASSMTFAIDRQLLPEASALTRDYLRAMSQLFESGQKTEVYNLSVVLFPLTNLKREKK
jgi:hypothetical protein